MNSLISFYLRASLPLMYPVDRVGLILKLSFFATCLIVKGIGKYKKLYRRYLANDR